MAKLIYTSICSLDGYVNDAGGEFDWSAPDEAVHAFVNDLERPIGTYLLGRGMYETLRVWDTMGTLPDEPPVIRDYAQIWRAAEKIVYSGTLDAVTTDRTRLEREFDADTVRRFVLDSDHDVSVGGPGLATAALRAGLVDRCQLFVNPIAVGGGTPVFPAGVRIGLELHDTHRFDNGVVFLNYAVSTT